MIRRYSTVKIFGEIELRNHLEQKKFSIILSIENEQENYPLNVSEDDYVKHKADEAQIELLEIHETQNQLLLGLLMFFCKTILNAKCEAFQYNLLLNC